MYNSKWWPTLIRQDNMISKQPAVHHLEKYLREPCFKQLSLHPLFVKISNMQVVGDD